MASPIRYRYRAKEFDVLGQRFCDGDFSAEFVIFHSPHALTTAMVSFCLSFVFCSTSFWHGVQA